VTLPALEVEAAAGGDVLARQDTRRSYLNAPRDAMKTQASVNGSVVVSRDIRN
jgi:hypothetical protein